MAAFFGILAAILVHLVFLLFGGLIFGLDPERKAAPREVELVAEDVPKEREPDSQPEPKPEQEKPPEDVPDQAELAKAAEPIANNDAPALDAASLGAIEAALNGAAGASGEFASQLSFASGGRIGGTGRGVAVDEKMENAFSLAEIDQKPRPVFQSAPLFPAELRGKRVEGLVSILCVIDAAGRVTNPRVEKSSHPAFERPALQAVRQWKFEAAVRGGQKVSCKLRIPIRFQPS